MQYYQYFDHADTPQRYWILSKAASFPGDKKGAPNLKAGEKKILWLTSDACPFGSVCIRENRDLNSVCEFFGGCRLSGERKKASAWISCRYAEGNILVSKLIKSENCAAHRQNCLGCEGLQAVVTDPAPYKSHCFVQCEMP